MPARQIHGGLAASIGAPVASIPAPETQSGVVAASATTGFVSFPIAFSTTPDVVAAINGSGDGAYALSALIVTPTGFSYSRTQIQAGTGAQPLRWMARG